MKVFIVHAHPEPRSFGAALLAQAVATLEARGDEVRVSDLYPMRFDPVASAFDFTSRRFPEMLQYDREQKHATAQHGFAPEIQAEIDKLLWCDTLILQFPLWWFSVPAILKGWIDRVFVNGVAYGTGRRLDSGGLKGRRAMLAVTTGCYEDMVAPDGMLGALDVNLWHLQAGTLAYAGMSVLPPFMAWSIHYTDDAERRRYLTAYAARLEALGSTEPMFFHPLADFGANWRLREGVQPATAGHRLPAAGPKAAP